MNLTFKALLKWSAGLLLSLPLAAGAAVSRPATPFTDAELDQMLAPIALYPDAVLSHVLIAATVPDEVEAAAEWSRRHPDLTGQKAVDAVEGKDWDPSVKALVAFPDVLARMDDDPEWTEDLGEAFLDQEAAVMDRVQYLRDRADAQGSLDQVEHVRVVREREYIYIEPAVSSVVYVPYYDPWVVYGSWWWPYYPPHHWVFWAGHPVRHYHGAAFYWGFGFRIGPSYYYPRFSWHHRHVVTTRAHRHYRPTTPGYSGRSDVRHRRVDGDHRRAQRPEWRHDSRRTQRDDRRAEPRRRDDAQRMRPRSTHDQVREGLRTRRESRGAGGSHVRSPQVRSERGGSVQRESRSGSESRGRGQERRATRAPETSRTRAERGGGGGREVRSDGRVPREVRGGDGGEARRGGGGREASGGGGRQLRPGLEQRGETLKQGRGNGGNNRRER